MPIPSHVRGSLSGGAILYKIWEMINQFPVTVKTSGSVLFLTHTDISNSANKSSGEQFQWRYVILKLCCYSSYQEAMLQIFSAVGT